MPAPQRGRSPVGCVARGSCGLRSGRRGLVYVRAVQQERICLWMRAAVTQRRQHSSLLGHTPRCHPAGVPLPRGGSSQRRPDPSRLSSSSSLYPRVPSLIPTGLGPALLQGVLLGCRLRALSSSARGQMLPDMGDLGQGLPGTGYLVFFQRPGIES